MTAINDVGGEYVGPSLWHGREVNSCTRCKYLRCQLIKSGRHPDYEYYCMHPTSLAGNPNSALLEKVRQKFPDRVPYFEALIANRTAEVAKYGQFISNDEVTPETPYWCPVVNEKGQSK